MTEPTITQADRGAATRWGTGPVYNMDDLARSFARHREAAEQATVDAIVAWLNNDADLTEYEARKVVANTTGNARQNAAEWAMLVRLKRGLARAIQSGEWRKK